MIDHDTDDEMKQAAAAVAGQASDPQNEQPCPVEDGLPVYVPEAEMSQENVQPELDEHVQVPQFTRDFELATHSARQSG
ncbi:hypothetical protein BIFGAL_03566 [Bifidobacterium gallicum DSM 20093 = LMG 11596]|uniref:Uncharacterized protein n=2 Tax=Bifidobacterium gallicum TaxID=78342 RepID=D1NUP0_9BIFI|nr:hypothetical protein BIFGAL_03566 [Bifidobacterium gallicum DSM 20093 = LMG 11596]KFI59532.1 hypothetical protein BGLCM_0197 [Bifidobacterium gallicum DSM 20093 = LMG 11596]